MRRVWVFAASACVAAAVYLGLVLTPPAGAGFAVGADGQAGLLDAIPDETLFAMKRAAARQGHAQVALFGNSRSINLGARDLGLPGCVFFNHSVAGSSFRSSVSMLELLTADGSAPAVAVISLDHLELGMMGQPEYLPLLPMLRRAMQDIAVPAAIRDRARTAWQHAFTLWRKAKRLLSSSYIAHAALQLAGRPATTGAAYRRDGSRVEAPPNEGGERAPPAFARARGDAIMAHLLLADLARLKALAGRSGGPRSILVYESLLHPDVARTIEAAPTPAVAALRARLASECARLGLQCRLGAAERDTLGPREAWADASHAPAAVLARHVGALVREADGCGKAAR